MNVFKEAMISSLDLENIAQWRRIAEKAEEVCLARPDGYGYYTPAGILRQILAEAKAGGKELTIGFPDKTQADRDNSYQIAQAAMEANLKVKVTKQNDEFKWICFGW